MFEFKGQLSVDGNRDHFGLVAKHQIEMCAQHKGEWSHQVQLFILPLTITHRVAHHQSSVGANAHMEWNRSFAVLCRVEVDDEMTFEVGRHQASNVHRVRLAETDIGLDVGQSRRGDRATFDRRRCS